MFLPCSQHARAKLSSQRRDPSGPRSLRQQTDMSHTTLDTCACTRVRHNPSQKNIIVVRTVGPLFINCAIGTGHNKHHRQRAPRTQHTTRTTSLTCRCSSKAGQPHMLLTSRHVRTNSCLCTHLCRNSLVLRVGVCVMWLGIRVVHASHATKHVPFLD